MPLRPLHASPLVFSLILLFAAPVTALAQWEMDLGTLNEFPLVKFQAQAGRVGTPGWRSDVNIRQAFDANALRELELDNAGANVTIQAIMVDEDGMELVSIGGANPAEVPLSRSRGGKPWKGTFKREGRDPHGLRVEVEQRSGQVRTVIRFARSLVDVPPGCLGGEERVLLTTSLTVDDGTDAAPVQFVATQPWRCKARRSGGWTLRGRNARGDA